MQAVGAVRHSLPSAVFRGRPAKASIGDGGGREEGQPKAQKPTQDTSPGFDPAPPPSSSPLLYLYAEHVVPTARWGTKAPLAGVRVKTNRLACALLAIAFWQLRE